MTARLPHPEEATGTMKFAYADPPYLGLAEKFYGAMHEDAAAYDRLETHAALVERLCGEFDAWAMSLHTPSLKRILSICPDEVRVGAWVKPFASFKKNVNPGYTWEPVLFYGGRRRGSEIETVRDYVACNITLQRGFQGAKPDGVCFWIFDFLGARPDDEFTDVFPGSGAVARAWSKWKSQTRMFA